MIESVQQQDNWASFSKNYIIGWNSRKVAEMSTVIQLVVELISYFKK